VPRRTVLVSIALLAALGVLVGVVATTGSAEAPARRSWGRAWGITLGPDATASAGSEVDQVLRVRLVTTNGAGVDVPPPGDSGGDYVVFTEDMLNQYGRKIGSVVATCMLVFLHSRCDGTFFFDGHGTLEVAGALPPGVQGQVLPITGGTGDFENARGEGHLSEGPNGATDFRFHIIIED